MTARLPLTVVALAWLAGALLTGCATASHAPDAEPATVEPETSPAPTTAPPEPEVGPDDIRGEWLQGLSCMGDLQVIVGTRQVICAYGGEYRPVGGDLHDPATGRPTSAIECPGELLPLPAETELAYVDPARVYALPPCDHL